LFGAICWTLWLNRKNCVFNNLLISSSRAVIFKLISFLQHWMVAAWAKDKAALEGLVDAIKALPEELMATEVGQMCESRVILRQNC
jgi:hypothetical protein